MAAVAAAPAPAPAAAGAAAVANGSAAATVAAVKAAKPKTKYLSAEQLKFWVDTGCLQVKANDMWSAEELKALIDGVNTMDSWPDKAGAWMKYYEKKGGSKPADAKAADGKADAKAAAAAADAKPDLILQRIENFVQFNEPLQKLLRGKLEDVASELFAETSILYKEKINYKLPGGAGFEPHQDISAGWWMYNQSIHISALVTIDEATKENGCLEVVYGKHKLGKLAPDWKAIPEDVVKTLDWVMLPTKPGDCFFFDSYVPHRSGPNTTQKPRRVLYATYAKLAEGDFREKYYADKRLSFPPDIERIPGKDYSYKI